jgi:hypothetical protein
MSRTRKMNKMTMKMSTGLINRSIPSSPCIIEYVFITPSISEDDIQKNYLDRVVPL